MNHPIPEDYHAPPTSHILRPHHIGLLTIFMLAFKEYENRKLPPAFVLHLYRVLMFETSEVEEPKSWAQLLSELGNGPMAEHDLVQSLITVLKDVHNDLKDADQMTSFFNGVSWLFMERGDEESSIFARRSLFGYFCRRCFITFIKLSFSGIMKLQKDYQAWRAGDLKAGYGQVEQDRLNDDAVIFKSKVDKKRWAQPEAYGAFEKAQAIGDENGAVENLRRFFEQHFNESRDSGYRQHALLNLVRTHYLRHEMTAARKILQEAIAVARTSGDKFTLQQCISMLHRLPPLEKGRKPLLNDIQSGLHPFEVLFDVKKLMQLNFEQPLSASFERVTEAIGVHDQWVDGQGNLASESEQFGQHAVQSILWSAAGCSKLSDIEENVVTAFTELGGNDNNRITVILNRAYKRARQGRYEEALGFLLEPDVWRGINMEDYELWAQEIWHILALRATRRGQDRLYREFLKPRRPLGHFNPRDYSFDVNAPPISLIRDPMHEVMQMKRCGQASTTIEQLLTALWHSEFQCRYSLYRTGIILLADVGLEFGMTKRCQKIIEEIMPQIINGDDIEQRAVACFTLARCTVAAGSPPESLRQALPYIIQAETDYSTLQIYASLAHVQYYLSVVYHNLGMLTERDEAVRRHFATEAERKRLEIISVDEEVWKVWKVVADVGAALSLR
ncbi:hypothetical protein JAAARDRAFT_31853 [Jaapia argillacea MUCL 33604]|uniref:Anaphase-promoting complex subunit 5 n=1 Tax=Jaapia argillacea MUCL 33604 TaxID=933084 RepID=A0A067Q3Y8_9AGAM|nr:hypothetical protein JAAARDRAFT_31853 [Jaapia argillacea MUCL 33604]